MDFFTSLLRAYESAEEMGLADNHQKEGLVLLPIYHTSLHSTGKNIITLYLDKVGDLFKAEILPEDRVIIFPVTESSVARSGKNPPPHPLVDKMNYFVPEINEAGNKSYLKQLGSWLSKCGDERVKQFLEIVYRFIQKPTFLEEVMTSLLGCSYQQEGLSVRYDDLDGKEKKLDFTSYFLNFTIIDFDGYKSVSVTDYVDLHQEFIRYIESDQENTAFCNISGRREVIANKHRGLIGNAKLISVSNNTETYMGRFRNRQDIFNVGFPTSERIHLMAKFLLENPHTHTWLGSGQYLINWFSDDLLNDSQLDVVNPSSPLNIEKSINLSDVDIDEIDFDDIEDNTELSEVYQMPSQGFSITNDNEEIVNSFIKGKKMFSDSAFYYVAILNKTSDGRISLKYFRQFQASQLLEKLKVWQQKYSWPRFQNNSLSIQAIPTLNEFIMASYGVERNGQFVLDNDKFQKEQFQNLLTNLLDGRGLPKTITNKLSANIRQRQKYKKQWRHLQFVTLAALHQQNGEDLSPMLEHENGNRSYLFGRLLAIFELIESERYRLNGGSDRGTNAERYWTAYTSQPAKIMENLFNKIRPYEDILKFNRRGIWWKLEQEKVEIIARLDTHREKVDFNSPLDYRFVFGYYAEKNFFYTKQVNNGNEIED